MKTLVLACGNTLRGDDAVGWRVAAGLEEELAKDGVEVLCTQQLLPEHAEPVSRAERVVFIDCSATAPAGKVHAEVVEPAETLPGAFTHHLEPAGLLKIALGFLGRCPAEAALVTVGGERFEVGEEMSGPVAAAVPVAVHAVKRLLA